MTEPNFPIFCADCGHTGSVTKIASGMQCRCGSTNLGLVGVDDVKTAAAKFEDPGGHHVQRYIDWALANGHEPEHTETLKRYEREPGIGRAHTNHIADQLYIGGGDTDWRGPHNRTQAAKHTAAPKGPGTGWTGPDPRRLDGFNEYAGPTPQTYPRSAPVADTTTCPVCKGTGYDLIDKAQCRECGGTGQIVHPTGRPSVESYDPGRTSPPGGAGWHGASLAVGSDSAVSSTNSIALGSSAMSNVGPITMTSGRPAAVPELSPHYQIQHSTPGYSERGYRGPAKAAPFNPVDAETFYPKADTRSPANKNWSPGHAPEGPYRMDAASCPNCGTRPTELVKDKNEDAWWHCPNCGPLANIDKHPEVNPYEPGEHFQPDRSMKTGGFMSRNKRTGRLLQMLAVIHDHNELDEREALTLARQSIQHYGEGR